MNRSIFGYMILTLEGRLGTFMANHVAYALVLSALGYYWWLLLCLIPFQVWLDAEALAFREWRMRKEFCDLKAKGRAK